MKNYTLGILFNNDLTQVILIQKNRPEWQKGKFNFPGGHIEEGELPHDCVKREFIEECNIDITNWDHIGTMTDDENFVVQIFTAICYESEKLKTMTDEIVFWRNIDQLDENCISNLHWLLPFVKNYYEKDGLKFGIFKYGI